MRVRRAEQRGVERGHQRRALSAGRDVAPPEVGDDRHAGALGHARRIVELDRPAEVGAVAHRLAVDAGGDDVGSGDAGARAGRGKRFRVEVGQREGGARRAGELVGPDACSASSSARSAVGQRQVGGAEHAAARPGAGAKSATTASTPSRLVPDITPA